MDTLSLGRRIAALRATRGMTGEQLGQVLGLSKSQVSKIENGTRKLDVSEVALVADALDVTLAEVLGVERKGGLALAARVMREPGPDESADARRRVRQVLECEVALSDAVGLPRAEPSEAGTRALGRMREAGWDRHRSPVEAGMRLAEIVREELGLGRAPIADLGSVIERHFGLGLVVWPVGKGVSGLCAQGASAALVLVSSSFPRGHQRFTACHELAHYLFGDPREVIIEKDIFAVESRDETRANAFAANLLMPAAGLREVIAGRPISESVLVDLMREFHVSYTSLVWRLSDAFAVKVLSAQERDRWLGRSVTSVLLTAGETDTDRYTTSDGCRRLPPRLATAALDGYRSGRAGLGVLATLRDEDADDVYETLANQGITPPVVEDDLADL